MKILPADGQGDGGPAAPAPEAPFVARELRGGFDLFVVGTGAAGMAAAIRGAELGARVAIAERGVLGGTCVNVGCIPSKALIEAAERRHACARGHPGLGACEPRVDWAALVASKDALVSALRREKYEEVLASYPEITLLRGAARLVAGARAAAGDARAAAGGAGVAADGVRVAVDGVERRARAVVLATGSSPALPPLPGLERVDPLDSTSAMALAELPASLLVLGGGAVGLELGQLFARLGTRVTVLEVLPRILAGEEPAVSEALRGFLEEEGVRIHTGVRVLAAERDRKDVVLRAHANGAAAEFRAERLLVAAGRRGNTHGLGLEEAGVETDARGFVRVDAALRTTNPAVYAAGDVTGAPAFVYVAAAAGRLAAENALTGAGRALELRAVPRVTFTSPQVGAVGATEEEAARDGRAVDVAHLELRHVPRAIVSRDPRGFVKLVAEPGGGRVLGVHAVGPHAGELMGAATLAVRFGLTVRDLIETLCPYLTWVEALRLAAQATTLDVRRLSCCA